MAFSILKLINAVIPKDGGSAKVARNLAYGPDPRHRLDIYAPKRRQGPLPVVFFIYGGSWMDGDRTNYDFVGRALAAQGFVTVIPDYRLLPTVEYPAFLEDCAEAFAYAVDAVGQYGGDASRIALAGHSAGAYNAMMITLDPKYLKARGLLDRVKAVAGLSGPYDFFPFDGRISIRTFGAVRNPKATQPVNHVADDLPRMWLATGDKDTLVYPRNTVALSKLLREQGIPVIEKHYETLGHPGTLMALAKPLRGMAPVLADMTAFLADALKR